MKTLLLASAAILCAGIAHAEIPTMNYSCPTGIELHVDQGGYAYLNGKKAKLKVTSKDYFTVSGNGVSVDVMTNPDGTRTVSYTGKHGANGMCSEANFSAAAATTPAPKKAGPMPKNMPAYCKGEAAGQFNTKPIYIQVGKPFATATGYAIKGTGDLGNQGKKPFQCNFDQNGKLQNFQSLVNEGSL
ncbi:hypothetical protein [Chitinibacter tainanensis]|uniref:hypothetical protein n=1 Tax=Chitinibacter tainanensis TaxID=230667 RepID=UPI00042463FE|nr:hypothetical protein [Chitinibacter tainanensis]